MFFLVIYLNWALDYGKGNLIYKKVKYCTNISCIGSLSSLKGSRFLSVSVDVDI